MNINALSPIVKSGCGRGPLIRGIDLIQLLSTVLVKYLRCIALNIAKVSGEGTSNRLIS